VNVNHHKFAAEKTAMTVLETYTEIFMAALDVPTLEEIAEVVRMIVRSELRTLSPPSSQDVVMNREEVMKKYNICSTTLHKRMKDGTIPFQKVGRKVIFSEKAVEKAITRIQ